MSSNLHITTAPVSVCELNNSFNKLNVVNIIKDNNEEQTEIESVNIFRYKFTNDVMDELTSFAKIHQYDDRKTYKDAWAEWIELNQMLIRGEIERLTSLGYTGNIIDKMYRASRYYFRNKTKKPQPVKRRKYISVDSEMLDAMDTHIHKNIKNEGYKPSVGYSDFCETNSDILRDEVAKMCMGDLSVDDIIQKIKKTYKNRYFIISRTI
jgi:hypothetical protein